MADADFAELLRKALVDFPVAARLPGRVHRSRERVDEGVHVAGVEVVLLVPGGGGQHDVGVETGRAHAEIQRHHQIELAFGCLVVPDHFGRLGFIVTEVLALHAMRGTEQVFEEILVPLAAGAQDVGAPDKHVARPVVGVVRVFAAHRQRAVFEALDGVVFGLHAGGGGIAYHLQRIGLELRR